MDFKSRSTHECNLSEEKCKQAKKIFSFLPLLSSHLFLDYLKYVEANLGQSVPIFFF